MVVIFFAELRASSLELYFIVARTHLREVMLYDTQPSSSRMSIKRKNLSRVSIDSVCTLIPVRIEKSNWERVSPVTVAGTGRGCVSDETSLAGEVKVKGQADVLYCQPTKLPVMPPSIW